jgi:predicted SPOUT superfamily RNA methylase MTH1
LRIIIGLLNPLDCPHHVRKEEKSPFREGVTINKKPGNSEVSLVNAGLSKVYPFNLIVILIFGITNIFL